MSTDTNTGTRSTAKARSTATEPTETEAGHRVPSRPAQDPSTRSPSQSQPRFTSGSLPRRAEWMVVSSAAALGLAGLILVDVHVVVVVIAVAVTSIAGIYAWSRLIEGRRRAFDRAISVTVTASFGVALTPLLSLLYTVVQRGAARFDIGLFAENMRGVVGGGGGIGHAIVGTVVITAVATVVSVPIGVLAAIYLSEYGGRSRLARALTFFVDVMTGIPSIVAGLFAYSLFVLFFGPGIRLGVMGAVALSVLMIPIVVRSTEEMLRVVPATLREASYALGVPKWRTIVSVVLPTSLAGIITGVTLAVARIIGETAPLLITTGVIASTNANPFEGRMANLPVFAYNEYSNPGVPGAPYLDRAWAAALVLIIIVMVLNLVARFISRRFGTRFR